MLFVLGFILKNFLLDKRKYDSCLFFFEFLLIVVILFIIFWGIGFFSIFKNNILCKKVGELLFLFRI